MDLSHITSLAELREAVEAFHGCTLRTPTTKTVFADGNPQARIMLIGEAPGAEEDRLGKPFVGRSGQLLDKMMDCIGLARTGEGDRSFYITNTVFWRPPDNRTPTPAETAACRPFMLKHIELINPALILLVGGTAAKAVLQTDVGITKLRLRFHKMPTLNGNEYLTLPTFHPAFLLRNPPAKKDAWEDLKMLHKKALELGLDLPPLPQKKSEKEQLEEQRKEQILKKAEDLAFKRAQAQSRFEDLEMNPGSHAYPAEMVKVLDNAQTNETAHALGYDRHEAEQGKRGRIK